MYDVVIVVNDIGVDTHLKVAKRVNPKNSHHKEKNCHCVWEWMVTSLVIISQCIQITNHYPVHLQIIQCVSITCRLEKKFFLSLSIFLGLIS